MSDVFPELTVQALTSTRKGAMKIGPFGSQLRKEEMVECGVKVYGQENVISNDWTVGERRIAQSKFRALSSCELEPGDLVVSMMGTAGKCAVFPATAERGIMDSHLLRVQPNLDLVDRDYFAVALQADNVVGRQVAAMSHGSIMAGLSSQIVKRFKIPLPPLEEQPQIVVVLRALYTAIHETEAIIAKLKAIKQGLLHDLLTRGIDANGELRPPHAEAPHLYKQSPLGWIPKDWSMQPLGYMAEVSRGKFTHRPRNDPRFYGGKHPFIQTGDVAAAEGEYVSTFSQTLSDRGTSVSQEFPAGTIAITIAANIADTAILAIPMFFPDSVVGAVVHDAHSVRFVELSIRKAKRGLDARAPQSAQKNINLQDLRPLLLAVPAREEQDAIAMRYEALQSQLQFESDCLEKYRQERAGLMDDLLTGRVRVTPLLVGGAP